MVYHSGMYVGYVQSSPLFGEKSHNFEQIDRLLEQREDGERAIDLLVLPELFSTGYTFVSREEVASYAEPADGETAGVLRQLAVRTGGVVVAGFAEREGERLYNSSLVVGTQGTIGVYRKIHLFNKEKLFFDRGETEPPVLDLGEYRLGVMICFDWIFPETMRLLMLKGADLVAHPSNLVLPYCQEAMKTRCLENRVYAVTANRVGTEARGEDSFTFTGASQVTSPDGRVMSRAPAQQTAIDFVEVEPDLARSKELNPYNDLAADRRVDLYGGLLHPDTSAEERR